MGEEPKEKESWKEQMSLVRTTPNEKEKICVIQLISVDRKGGEKGVQKKERVYLCVGCHTWPTGNVQRLQPYQTHTHTHTSLLLAGVCVSASLSSLTIASDRNGQNHTLLIDRCCGAFNLAHHWSSLAHNKKRRGKAKMEYKTDERLRLPTTSDKCEEQYEQLKTVVPMIRKKSKQRLSRYEMRMQIHIHTMSSLIVCEKAKKKVEIERKQSHTQRRKEKRGGEANVTEKRAGDV